MSQPWCFGNLNYDDCEMCPAYNACFEEAVRRDQEQAELNTVEIAEFTNKADPDD